MKIIMKCLILLLFFFISVSQSYAKEILLATGFKGGTYYSMGMDLKDIWQKVGIDTHVLESKGAWQNLLDILDNKVDVAFTQLDAYLLASFEFKKSTGKQLNDYVQAVSVLHPEEIHILSAGKIKEFNELNGARVGCGPKNSGSCITAQFLSYAFNINMNLVNASYEESLDMLKKGSIDALIITVGKPAKLLANLSGYD